MTADSAAPTTAERRVPGRWIAIGRVGQVRIFVDPLLPLLLVLFAVLGVVDAGAWEGLLILVGLPLFVFLHEAGHAWMARRRGLAVRGIFMRLTSVTYVEQGTAADEMRVALAGPAVNLVLGGLLLGARVLLGPLPPFTLRAYLSDPLAFAAAANLVIGCFNLLPVLPADGGWALRAFLEGRGPKASARRVVGWLGVGAGMSVALGALFLAPWPLAGYLGIVALWILVIGFESLWRARARRA